MFHKFPRLTNYALIVGSVALFLLAKRLLFLQVNVEEEIATSKIEQYLPREEQREPEQELIHSIHVEVAPHFQRPTRVEERRVPVALPTEYFAKEEIDTNGEPEEIVVVAEPEEEIAEEEPEVAPAVELEENEEEIVDEEEISAEEPEVAPAVEPDVEVTAAPKVVEKEVVIADPDEMFVAAEPVLELIEEEEEDIAEAEGAAEEIFVAVEPVLEVVEQAVVFSEPEPEVAEEIFIPAEPVQEVLEEEVAESEPEEVEEIFAAAEPEMEVLEEAAAEPEVVEPIFVAVEPVVEVVEEAAPEPEPELVEEAFEAAEPVQEAVKEEEEVAEAEPEEVEEIFVAAEPVQEVVEEIVAPTIEPEEIFVAAEPVQEIGEEVAPEAEPELVEEIFVAAEPVMEEVGEEVVAESEPEMVEEIFVAAEPVMEEVGEEVVAETELEEVEEIFVAAEPVIEVGEEAIAEAEPEVVEEIFVAAEPVLEVVEESIAESEEVADEGFIAAEEEIVYLGEDLSADDGPILAEDDEIAPRTEIIAAIEREEKLVVDPEEMFIEGSEVTIAEREVAGAELEVVVTDTVCVEAEPMQLEEAIVQKEPEPEVRAIELRGLVLTDKKENMLSPEALQDVHGLYVSGLLLPGPLKKLAKVLNPIYFNQPLDQQKIKEIKCAIASYYEAYYDPFVLVEVPSQNISAGVLQLVVVQGKVGEIGVRGNKWFSNQRIKKYLQVKPGDDINLYTIQRDLEVLNRNPFRRVNMIYSPGKEFGTTDLVLAIDDCRPIRVYSGADNSGIETINRQRMYTGITFGNFLGLDHLLSYQYTTSYDFSRFQGHTGQYMAPLPWGHFLNVFGGYSTVHPQQVHFMIKNRGTTGQASLRYVMPFTTRPRTTQEFSIGCDYKFTDNTILYSEEITNFGNYLNLTQIALEYKHHQETAQARFDCDLQLFCSPGKLLIHQENRRFNELRVGARSKWVYLRSTARYLQALPKDFQLSLWLQGQWTSAALLPMEQFGLGGYASVRGYDERQLSMDSGFSSSLEIRSPLVPLITMLRSTAAKDSLQALAFIDYGWGLNNHSVQTEPNAASLLGIGPGLRYTLDPYIAARLDWGIKLHNRALFTGGASEVHFNVNLSY